jgi:putative glutamine amidotransferase
VRRATIEHQHAPIFTPKIGAVAVAPPLPISRAIGKNTAPYSLGATAELNGGAKPRGSPLKRMNHWQNKHPEAELRRKGDYQQAVIGLNMSMSAPHTFSLVTDYPDALVEAGSIPCCLPAYAGQEQIKAALVMLDGFLFIGGKDYLPSHYGGREQPMAELMEGRRDAFDILLARVVLKETELPVLGICGGAQLINIVMGGALVQDIASDWFSLTGRKALAHREGTRHSLTVVRDSMLWEITKQEKMNVNSYHHQAIHPRHLGVNLKVTAKSSDGVVEAIEYFPQPPQAGRFILGLQWHPERLFRKDELQKSIFHAFVGAALAYRAKRNNEAKTI